VRHYTVTAVFPAPKERVFSYLAEVENLPLWATDFARELKRVDGEWKVVNGLGEFVFRIEADSRTGVIDMLAGPTPDELGLFPTRVVPVGEDASAFTFTMFQGPGQPDEIFDAQYRSLLRELENLEREFAG
jgi:hypothetical protein